jgi:hypothetical protein
MALSVLAHRGSHRGPACGEGRLRSVPLSRPYWEKGPMPMKYNRSNLRRVALACCACAVFVFACGDTQSYDGGGDAGIDAPTTLADCSPTCGQGNYCAYPRGPGMCPSATPDAGSCVPGCPGCSPLPAPSCKPLPAACAVNPSCDCLQENVCGSGCGLPSFNPCGYKNGDWILDCMGC